jgi:hypothetical protein
MDILNNLLSGNENMNNIKNQLFDVVKVDLVTNLNGFTNPNGFGIYKSTGGECFGMVRGNYEPTQPKMLFDSFENCLYNTDANFNDVRYLELRGGKKVVFEAPIKTTAFRNKAGKSDENIIKLNLSTGFDGHTKSAMFISVYRQICSNGMKGWLTEFSIEVKNVRGNLGKITELCDSVAKAVDKANDYEEFMKTLNRRSVNTEKIEKFMLKTLGYNNQMRSELHQKKVEKLDIIYNSIELEFSRTGSTLWGLVNGFTHYTNHVADTKNVTDSILDGTGLKLNNEAQKVALSMI